MTPAQGVADLLAHLSLAHLPWMRRGACATSTDPDAWFPAFGEHRAGRTAVARRTCRGCPVRQQCLTYALDRERRGQRLRGIWGGLTEQERTSLINGHQRKADQ